MNIMEILDKELQDKDWNLYQKARYLYTRSGEIFTYDSRYSYVDLKRKQEIFHKTLDLEHLIDNQVVCSSWAKAYLEFLKIIGLSGEILGEEDHQFVVFSIDSNPIVADACLTSDLSRIKIKCSTKRFYPLSNKHYQVELRQNDQEIHYITDNYFDDHLDKNLCEKKDPLLQKLYKIKNVFEKEFSQLSYYDANFFLSYAMIKRFSASELKQVKEIELYREKEKWEFVKLFSILLSGENHFFALAPVEDRYHFLEISKNQFEEYLSNYQKKKKKRL